MKEEYQRFLIHDLEQLLNTFAAVTSANNEIAEVFAYEKLSRDLENLQDLILNFRRSESAWMLNTHAEDVVAIPAKGAGLSETRHNIEQMEEAIDDLLHHRRSLVRLEQAICVIAMSLEIIWKSDPTWNEVQVAKPRAFQEGIMAMKKRMVVVEGKTALVEKEIQFTQHVNEC